MAAIVHTQSTPVQVLPTMYKWQTTDQGHHIGKVVVCEAPSRLTGPDGSMFHNPVLVQEHHTNNLVWVEYDALSPYVVPPKYK